MKTNKVDRETTAKINQNFKLLKQQVAEADALALQILSHPKATANQVMHVHQTLVNTREHLRAVQKSINELGLI